MPTDKQVIMETRPQTVFSISRSLFRDFFTDLVTCLNELDSINNTSKQVLVWCQSGLGDNSKWREIIVFVNQNSHTNCQQPSPTVVKKLVPCLLVINTFYMFEFHSNNTVTAVAHAIIHTKVPTSSSTPSTAKGTTVKNKSTVDQDTPLHTKPNTVKDAQVKKEKVQQTYKLSS